MCICRVQDQKIGYLLIKKFLRILHYGSISTLIKTLYGGDLNLNLESRDVLCDLINQFVSNNRLIRCDHLFFEAYYNVVLHVLQ